MNPNEELLEQVRKSNNSLAWAVIIVGIATILNSGLLIMHSYQITHPIPAPVQIEQSAQ